MATQVRILLPAQAKYIVKNNKAGFERERGRENGSFPVAEVGNRWVPKSPAMAGRYEIPAPSTG